MAFYLPMIGSNHRSLLLDILRHEKDQKEISSFKLRGFDMSLSLFKSGVLGQNREMVPHCISCIENSNL